MLAFPDAPALRILPANLQGRDFIVGDLHGMAGPLRRALAHVAFDTAADRLFSVGDLVDRGPESMACLRLLRQPWFHAVLGNHERMLLAHLGYRETPIMRFHAWRYSRPWVQNLTPAEHTELVADLGPRIAALPLALRVDAPERFYLLHAERHVQGQTLTDAALEAALAHPVHQVERPVREALTWSRQLSVRAMTGRPPCEGPTISRTYVGHTITSGPLEASGHTYLDRGAYQMRDPDEGCIELVEHATAG